MSDKIMEDSQSIKNIGTSIIDEDIKSFNDLTKELFEELNREIGLDQSHQTWYGPNAELFMNNVNPKENEFYVASKNIANLGMNLEDQGKAWEKFEKN